MERTHRRQRRGDPTLVLLGAGFVLLLLVVLAWVVFGAGEPSRDAAPAPSTAPGQAESPPAARSTGMPSAGGVPEPPGGAGKGPTGFDPSMGTHQVELTIEAEGDVAGLYWTLPRAKGASKGVDSQPGRSWHLTKTVSGPAWAGLYAQTGRSRGEVRCTVTFDGEVISSKVAQGPWGEVYCGAS